MAKEAQKIHTGVVLNGETITDTDRLAEVATPEQLQHLTKQGAISGFAGSAVPELSKGEGAFGPAGDEPKEQPKPISKDKK